MTKEINHESAKITAETIIEDAELFGSANEELAQAYLDLTEKVRELEDAALKRSNKIREQNATIEWYRNLSKKTPPKQD